MKSIVYTFIVVLLMCCAIQSELKAQPIVAQSPYRFQHFLPYEWIWTIAQDSLGFIWAYSSSRLYRFDGYNFKVFKHDPDDTVRSLPRGAAGGIFSDPTGNIWLNVDVQGHGFSLAKYDVRKDVFLTFKTEVPKEDFTVYRFDKTKPIIWFGTRGKGLYSFNFQTRETRNFFNEARDSLTRAHINSVLTISDRDSSILIASVDGLWSFDKKTERFNRPPCNPSDSAFLYHASILKIYEGPNNNRDDVWLWLERKLLNVNHDLAIVKNVNFPDGVISSTSDRDKEGIFWFATANGKGLYAFDPKKNSFVNFRNVPGVTNSLKSNLMTDVLVDKDQNIWLGSFYGFSRLQKPKLRFYNFNIHGLEESSSYHGRDNDYIVISKVVEGVHKILISPVFPGRLDSLHFKPLTEVEGIVHGAWKGKKNFWISAFAQGVIQIPFDSISEKLRPDLRQVLSYDAENPNTISSNATTVVWEDANENLWVATRGDGLNKIMTGTPYGSIGSVVRYSNNSKSSSISSNTVWNVFPEDEKAFWVVTTAGVDLFKNDGFEHVVKNKVRAMFAYKASDSILYVGADDGLYKGIKRGEQYVISQRPVFQVDQVNRIQGDKLGRMWISNQKSIYCYDPSQQIAIEFNEDDGFGHWGTLNPWFKKDQTSAGIMVIPDEYGISLFDPLALAINKGKTFPALTDLKVNNQTVPVREAGTTDLFSIDENVSVLDELTLDYQHNNFTVEFAAMEMNSPEKNFYRHKLEGYEQDWIETDWKNRTATYTNLDAGDYVFKVRASNHHGIWSDQEKKLKIRILPPPWKTWWAYSLYGLALVGIFYAWRSYDIKRVKLKHRAEHLSELDTLKTRFFANISHEFRTPITLILGPLKELYNEANNEEQKSLLGTTIRNGQRLLRLVNQLLDLSRLEAGKIKIQASQTEVVQFLREIAASYESLAAQKKIRFSFYSEIEEVHMYLDQEKIEKVVHNILSNAFKFTNENGEVILKLRTDNNQQAIISVIDTGIGIPNDQLNHVFDRFYQVDNSQTREYEGSGIGMALAKELVELHQGTISVESEVGKGSAFTVRLPLDKKYGLEKEGILQRELKREGRFTNEIISERIRTAASTSTSKESASETQSMLLIVEDNEDMRNYIARTLGEDYKIVEATNGKEGVEKARELLPDLIISDIMMPEMDGYKLCELIKTTEMTSHIPVILLTAKADQQSKLTGLEQRADDYLLKPFDTDELKLIVRNHIEARQKMREKFSREITLEPTQIAVSSMDEKFLTKVLALIEAHMEDENFSIEDFSHEAGYSRMQFYRKIKSLSGQTPSQFVRTIRLKRAAQMLAGNSDNVTQIAYSVGFRSLAYFDKCFKEQFGVTPGQFSNEHFKSRV